MTVFLWEKKLSYIAVPKVACTSVKSMFFRYENGRPFRDFVANGSYFHIHKIYPGMKFDQLPHGRIADHDRLALIRSPVRRFLSAYSNRVVFYRELSAAAAGEALAERELTPDPDLATFIDRIADYRAAVPSIFHHTRPMVDFLGRDTGYFAALYPLARMRDFVAEINRRLETGLKVQKLHTEGPKIDPSSLSGPQIAALQRFYAEDYSVFGGLL